MHISDFALKNRLLINFLVIALLCGGVWSFFKMGKSEDPELKVRVAQIVTIYPGASAREVEQQITLPLEKAIRAIPEVGEVSSKSCNDLSIIQVILNITLPEKEIPQGWDLLRRAVSDTRAQLPEEARTPIVMDDFGDVYGLFYAMTADGFQDKELNHYADVLKQELQTVEGVGKVALYGEQKPCVYIDIQQDKLKNRGVHFYELLLTIRGQNQMVYPGYFNAGDARVRVNITDKYNNINDIKNLLIRGHEDDCLSLKDIAHVYEGVEMPVRNSMRFDTLPAIGVAISMAPGHDITKVGKNVKHKLKNLFDSGVIPVGITCHKVFFQSERVEEAIYTFLLNLLESVLIVVAILMLTMGARSGIILGINLVIIVLGSFFVLNLFDGTLQRVSLGSLILAMGMLVDNAIVVIDGVLIDTRRGLPYPDLLTHTAKKTALPLLGATLIAILAFFPIFLSPDMAGVYVRDLFIVLTVSLLISWLLALTLVPMQADRLLVKRVKKTTGELFSGKFYRVYRRVLVALLNHKAPTIAVVVLLLLLSAWGFRFVKQGFFPDFKYEQAYIEYKMPEGTRIEKVRADLQDMEKLLMQRKDIKHVTTSLGGTPFRYNLVRSFAEPSLGYGEIIVDFQSPEAMQEALPQLQKILSERYPQAFVRLKKYNLMYKPFPIEILFTGPDPAVLKKLSARAEQIMRAEPSLMLAGNDWEPLAPVYTIQYEPAAARAYRVTRSDIALSTLAATDGIPIASLYFGDTPEPVYLRSLNAKSQPIEDLDNIPILPALPSSRAINRESLLDLALGTKNTTRFITDLLQQPMLNQVTNSPTIAWEDLVIRHYNGQRAIRSRCNNQFGFTPEQARAKIKDSIEAIPLPAGYTMSWQGEVAASKESTRYLFANIPLAIVLMITILLMLFKDFRKTSIIVLCVPLAAIGVVSGLLVFDREFGFVAIVGTLGLIGMMIKNGIVLIDEISLLIKEGTPLQEALVTASLSRLLPVTMAAGTTILGMIPLLSDVLFGAMAVSIMGGLLAGTCITLFVIPVLYALFYKK
ncbi:MAG: efflux RND transporter permease subunit [Bacteroidales bacterium]|jgi:multidrug efflux pump subunit AcrB|nr:efflux RND transporter permease subunit [Bacteroidales bacterium]